MKKRRGVWCLQVPLLVMLLGLLFVSVPAYAMTVSGKVANNSGDTGRVYVGLKQTWGGNFVYSVSLPNPGTTATSFVIKGVENGTYNLFAFVDRTNTGIMHANDPVVQRSVTVSGSNYSTGNLTISAKSLVLPSAALASPGILPASGSAGVVIENATDANGAVIADSYNVSCNGGTIVRNNVPTVSLTGDSAVLVITGLSNGSTLSCNTTPVIRGSARSTYKSADGSDTIGDTCNSFGTCGSGVTVSGKVNFTGFSSLSGKTLLVALSTWNGMPYVTTIGNPTIQQAWSIPGVQASASAYRTSLYLIDNATGVWQGQINERTEQARLTVEGGDNVIAPTQTFPLRNTIISVSAVSQYGPNNTDPTFSLSFNTFWSQKRPVNITLSNVTGAALPAEGVSLAGMDSLRVFTGNNRPTSDDSYQASLEYSDGSSEILPLAVIKGGSQETLAQSFPVGNVRMPDLTNPVYGWHYGIPTGMIPFTSSVYSGNQYLENLTSASNWVTLSGSSLNLNSQYWLTTELQDVMGDAIEFSGDYTPVGSGPVISSFSPTSGPGGATVTINGSGFTSATRVTFNGVADKNFTVVSGSQIIAHVPGGASRGPITVTDNNQVTGASSAPFEKTVTVAGTLTNTSNAGVNGVTVRAIGGGVPITVTSATSGGVAGKYSMNVPAGVPLQYKMHDASGTYLDSYSKLITATNNYDGSYSMIRTSDLTGWAAVDPSFTAVANSTTGMIRGRVATPADVNLSGATVQVMSKNHPGGSPSYKVIYGNGSNTPDTTKTATSSDGRFFVTGIEQGDIVYAQVTLAGYAFQDTFYQVYNGSVSGGKVNGDLMPNQLTLTPNGGQVGLQQTVTVSWDPALTGTLYYTTDGTNPRSNGTGIPVTSATSASFTLTAEGSQQVRCILKNNAGVFGDEVQTSFYVMQDTIPPQVIVMPPGTAFGSGYGYSNTLPIPVTFISDEPATIWFTTDGSDPFTSASRLSVVVPTAGGSVSAPAVADGTVVKFYGIDLANNQSQERIVTMIFDNTAPVISTVSPNSFSGTNTFNATNTSFFITATDNSSPNVMLWYLVTDSTATPAVNATGWSTNSMVNVTVPGEGSYTRYVWVKDEAGNISQYRLLSFTVDMTPPARPVITPYANNRSNSQQVYIAGTAEANATVTVYDGGTLMTSVSANGSGVWGVNWFFAEGTTHTLTATATDVAGNTGLASPSVTVTVDSLPPVTSASSNPPVPGTGFYTPGTAVTVTFTASEAATVYYTTNGVDPNPAACTGACKQGASPLQIPITNSTTFKFLSVDTAGNVETSVNTVSYSYGQPTITTVQQANAPVTYIPGSSTLTLTAIVTSASTPTGTVTFLVDGNTVGSPVSLDGSGIATQNYTGVISAGTHTIIANFSGNAQFSASLGSTTFNVAKATATLSAGSITRTYTAALQSVPYTTTPPGLTASFSFSQGGIAVLPLNAGSYDFSGSVEDPNYQGSATGTLNIQKASLSVTPGSTVVANRAYNGSTAATITSPGTLSGILAQDNVTLTGGTATFADANVGNAKPVAVIGLALAGTGAGNYTLGSSTASASANITPAALTVTANAQSKVYGSADPSFTYTPTGTLYGSDALTGALGRAGGESVAGSPYAINIGTLSAGSNYSITFVPANLTVTAKPLAINGITANSKVYDGTRSATLNTGTVTLGGVVGSDVVSLSGSASGTFDTKNAGTGKTVSFSGLSLSGAAAGNYSITTTASTTANITPAPLTVNAGTTVVGNKGYDGSTLATITTRGTLSGILSPDVVTLAGGSANFGDANVGTGKAVTITGLT
ncbi:beta strand repeat-containing protein, partial [Geomonas limicola]|uniref:beta strand repeat-containing protein n=1 Tax=Geomonas limicola TaxID=2740186 RepID=UPI0016084CCA